MKASSAPVFSLTAARARRTSSRKSGARRSSAARHDLQRVGVDARGVAAETVLFDERALGEQSRIAIRIGLQRALKRRHLAVVVVERALRGGERQGNERFLRRQLRRRARAIARRPVASPCARARWPKK